MALLSSSIRLAKRDLATCDETIATRNTISFKRDLAFFFFFGEIVNNVLNIFLCVAGMENVISVSFATII